MLDFNRNHTVQRLRARRPRVAILAFAAVPLGVWSPAQAAPLTGEFTGGAASVSISAGGPGVALQVGTSARVGCPCGGTHGRTHERTTSSIAVGPGGAILSAATTDAAASAGKTAGTAQTTQTSTITKLDLLGGLITADALGASASASATPDQLTVSDAGTILTNLKIAGQAIDPGVPDNTVITLPGIGAVTVKAIDTHTGKQAAHIGVDVLLIDVTQANSFLPVGARLVVARADAGYKRAQPAAALGGDASAARVRGDAGNPLDEAAGSGSGVGLASCDGTGGKTETKSVTDISLPGFLSVGTAAQTAFGGPVGGAEVAKTTSTLSNVSFLGGLIAADALVAVAEESRVGSTSTASTSGSGVDKLTLAGVPVHITTQANTKLTLPGVGYVVVNEQIARGTDTIVVNALHVVVTTANLLGLPVGAEILLGHADAVAKKF